jgi:MFS family permease
LIAQGDEFMTTTETWPGRVALMVAHCAGMVDLVALPIWIGTLIVYYKFDPQQAGGLATLFLVGAVASSLVFAPRFTRIRGRLAAALGFGVAALAFFAVSLTTDYLIMAALHALAGITAGCALTFTHGTIGRSRNPHRLFAIVSMALGVFAIVFLGGTPKLVALTGGATLFRTFAGVMLVGAVAAAVAFPETEQAGDESAGVTARLERPVWFAIGGISCMALAGPDRPFIQSMNWRA